MPRSEAYSKHIPATSQADYPRRKNQSLFCYRKGEPPPASEYSAVSGCHTQAAHPFGSPPHFQWRYAFRRWNSDTRPRTPPKGHFAGSPFPAPPRRPPTHRYCRRSRTHSVQIYRSAPRKEPFPDTPAALPETDPGFLSAERLEGPH